MRLVQWLGKPNPTRISVVQIQIRFEKFLLILTESIAQLHTLHLPHFRYPALAASPRAGLDFPSRCTGRMNY